MPRPRIYQEDRVATAVRIPASLHNELKEIASQRDVSVNFLVIRALSDLVARVEGVADPLATPSRT